MKIEPYASIKDRHSFHCDVHARFWTEYDTVGELEAILRDASDFGLPIMPVGAGSNLLFRDDYPGILLHSNIQGIEIIESDLSSALVRVGSGVVWDDFVAWAVSNGLAGVENLSGIPSSVGATPVQNIGAYGVEVKDVLDRVEVLDRETLETTVLKASDCALGYRDSLFKHEWKDKYVVTHVVYRLTPYNMSSTSAGYSFRLDYGQLRERVMAATGGNPTLEAVRECVLAIRGEKLPDPSVLGNAGSFFVNPELTEAEFKNLQEKFPEIPFWDLSSNAEKRNKVPAAWLIEQAGWKGKNLGEAGCYEKQPLVLVNRGQATGNDIYALYEKIAADVERISGICLCPETVII